MSKLDEIRRDLHTIHQYQSESAAEQMADTLVEHIEFLLAEVESAKAALQRVRDLHLKVEDPRHGCCAAPKLCDGHAPECRGSEHPIGGVRWPCATLRAIEEGS